MTVANYYMKKKVTIEMEEKEFLQYEGLCLKPGMVIKRKKLREPNGAAQGQFFVVLRIKRWIMGFSSNVPMIVLECLTEETATQNIVFHEDGIVEVFQSDYEIYSGA